MSLKFVKSKIKAAMDERGVTKYLHHNTKGAAIDRKGVTKERDTPSQDQRNTLHTASTTFMRQKAALSWCC